MYDGGGYGASPSQQYGRGGEYGAPPYQHGGCGYGANSHIREEEGRATGVVKDSGVGHPAPTVEDTFPSNMRPSKA